MEVMDFAEELIISSFLNSCIVSPNDKKLTTVGGGSGRNGKFVGVSGKRIHYFTHTRQTLAYRVTL